jgi:hypothetical protein
MKGYDVSVKRYWFVFGEKLSQCQFVYRKFHTDKPDTLHSQLILGAKELTNWLFHITSNN